MKKAKNNKSMKPDQSVLEGIPTKDPHKDFAKKDASFKKPRESQQ
jgi:hypothetical protein